MRRSGEALERRAILVMKDIVDREDTMIQSLDFGEAREIIRQVSWSEKSRPTSLSTQTLHFWGGGRNIILPSRFRHTPPVDGATETTDPHRRRDATSLNPTRLLPLGPQQPYACDDNSPRSSQQNLMFIHFMYLMKSFKCGKISQVLQPFEESRGYHPTLALQILIPVEQYQPQVS